MERPNLLQIPLNNTSPEILSPVSEYLLWSAEVHIYFVINEFSNNVLGRLFHSFSNWPSGRIIHCCNNPPVSRRCLWKDEDEVDSPALKWLNKRVRHNLMFLPFLNGPVPLVSLTIRTRRHKCT